MLCIFSVFKLCIAPILQNNMFVITQGFKQIVKNSELNSEFLNLIELDGRVGRGI